MNEAHDDEGGWGSLADELGLDESKPAKQEKRDEEIVDEAAGEAIGEAPELLEDESEETGETASAIGENGEPVPGKKKRRRRRRGKKKENGEAAAPGADGESAAAAAGEESEEDEDGEPVSAMDEENVSKPSFANVVAWKDLVATLHRPH